MAKSVERLMSDDRLGDLSTLKCYFFNRLLQFCSPLFQLKLLFALTSPIDVARSMPISVLEKEKNRKGQIW